MKMALNNEREIRMRRKRLLMQPLGWAVRIAAMCLFLVGTNYQATAQAGTATANLAVQITITAACTISAATLNFGSSVSGISIASTPLNGSTTTSVTCTNASPYSIAMDNGLNVSGSQRRMANGGNFINYNLYVDAARLNPWTTATSSTVCTTTSGCYLGIGTGSAQTITVYGTVPSTTTAPNTGTYSDTVTMTITY
jgi:spore coat protein U-like protein